MARIHAKAVAHYVDEFDFSGVSNNAELVLANNIADATAFADTDMTYVEGKGAFRFNFQGFFDPVAGGYDAEMFTDLTTVDRMIGVFSDDVAGQFGYEGQSNPSRQARTAERTAAILLNVDWLGDKIVHRAVLLDVDTAVAARANGTADQQGSVAATETARGVLRLLAAPGGAGSNTLDVVIASDSQSDFLGTPETQMTFTQLSEASVALFEVQTAAGAITDDWWRVQYTYAGAGSRTFSLVISLGIYLT